MLNAAVFAPRTFAQPQATTQETATARAELVRVALLGVGTVGTALLARLDALTGSSLTQCLRLVHIANSSASFSHSCESLITSTPGGGRRVAAGEGKTLPIANVAGHSLAATFFPDGDGLDIATAALGAHGTRIVIDATASEAVADHHAHWLAQGIHVVTACKLGQGTTLARWRAIRAACERGSVRYGDSATVGAGLPLLRSLRELKDGGDAIHAIAGVLSGSLAWLFNRYDGMRPFSALVRQARAAGYTEPDPREDLSGEDVRRKLLILARAAGFDLDADAVAVESLVPETLARMTAERADEGLALLDVPLRDRYAMAYKRGEKLRFVARLERDGNGIVRARVGLESLSADHPLAGSACADNRIAIWSDRYREQPLLIQGPGAGAQVTAAALLDDVLRIVRMQSMRAATRT